MGVIPIVSLDKIYLNEDEENVIFLDCTRLNGSSKLVSRNNSNDFSSVDEQVKKISEKLKVMGLNQIILVDDVVFSGSVLSSVIELFKNNGISVIGIRSAVATTNSFKRFNNELGLGLKCKYLLGEEVIDQICERDFYFGIPQSGISILEDGIIYKAPYFRPFGNPVERASIPKEYEDYFSKGCLKRSIWLWNEIERLSDKSFYISDLPEVIFNTSSDEKIVKVLKKGVK